MFLMESCLQKISKIDIKWAMKLVSSEFSQFSN